MLNSFLRALGKENTENQQESAPPPAVATNPNLLINAGNEMHTPIDNILQFTNLILEDSISDKTRERVLKIVKNTKALLDTVNNIMDISKIESSKLELRPGKFNIGDVLSRCRSTIKPSAVSKNIMLHFYAEPHLGKFLVGDAEKLGNICINILAYAVKSTDFGAIKCSVIPVTEDDDSCTLKFEVRDSGAGMASWQAAQIIDPSSESVNPSLLISRRLVELMGGQLSVESAEGLGSCFHFTLTFPTVAKPEEVEQKPEPKPVVAVSTSTSISDDDAFFTKILIHFVKNNQNTYNDIVSAIDNDDMTLAYRTAHNLKSNSGHIQKTALQMAAAELERAIKEQRPCDEPLSKLKLELELVLAEHADLNEETPTQKNSFDRESALKAVEGLEMLLKHGDVEYLDYIDNLKTIPGTDLLVSQMENFESLDAIVTLESLKREWS